MAVRSQKEGTIYTEFQRGKENGAQPDITAFFAETASIDVLIMFAPETSSARVIVKGLRKGPYYQWSVRLVKRIIGTCRY